MYVIVVYDVVLCYMGCYVLVCKLL